MDHRIIAHHQNVIRSQNLIEPIEEEEIEDQNDHGTKDKGPGQVLLGILNLRSNAGHNRPAIIGKVEGHEARKPAPADWNRGDNGRFWKFCLPKETDNGDGQERNHLDDGGQGLEKASQPLGVDV